MVGNKGLVLWIYCHHVVHPLSHCCVQDKVFTRKRCLLRLDVLAKECMYVILNFMLVLRGIQISNHHNVLPGKFFTALFYLSHPHASANIHGRILQVRVDYGVLFSPLCHLYLDGTFFAEAIKQNTVREVNAFHLLRGIFRCNEESTVHQRVVPRLWVAVHHVEIVLFEEVRQYLDVMLGKYLLKKEDVGVFEST